jgi:starch synthase (maltosyl-transferring)
MGFNWIYINPIQYPGFSGSLYAIKDFYRLNPLFVPANVKDPIEAFKKIVEGLHRQGLQIMLDLVINHTSKDSELIQQRPQWFQRDAQGEVKSPFAIDPSDARKVTVWGDLAEVDNDSSPDREGLWKYWTDLVKYYLDLGVDGFRCDAAYKVPCQLWAQLTAVARQRRPSTMFAAETLGCRLSEVRMLDSAGFDYLFNSSKWWDFTAPWCLEQHEEFREIAPSISFPESHDTPRLMMESGGLVQVQKQRYAFSAFFAAGVLMPLGYEFGFTKAVNVVTTMPQDWEQPSCDLSAFIKNINQWKREIAVLGVEGSWKQLPSSEATISILVKSDPTVGHPVVLLINKDVKHPQILPPPCLDGIFSTRPQMVRVFHEQPKRQGFPPQPLQLDPAEIVLLVAPE